jgi:hypothetical protein
MTQSVRLVGRHFQGVVSSGGSSPDSSQDVAKVFPERARIVVSDGAGDTGGAAGEWAGILALCYGSAQEMVGGAAPEWLDRAVQAWNHASNLSRFDVGRGAVNQQELALLQTGVNASFIGAAFDDRRGALFLNWVAAGDCEAFLFRDGRLQEHGPIFDWRDFSPTARSLNSKTPQPRLLTNREWPLQEGDVLILCSDALGQFILKACDNDGNVPSEVQSLMRCAEWQELRQYVESWRRDHRLRNDDVAIVRVTIQRGQGGGRFSLMQDTRSVARTPIASPVPQQASLPEATVVAAPRNSSGSSARSEVARGGFDEPKIHRPVLYNLIGTFIVGVMVGAILAPKHAWAPQSPDKVAERQTARRRQPMAILANPTTAVVSTASNLTADVGELIKHDATVGGAANEPQSASSTPDAKHARKQRGEAAATRDAAVKEEKGSTKVSASTEPVNEKKALDNAIKAGPVAANSESPTSTIAPSEPVKPAVVSTETAAAILAAQATTAPQVASSTTAGTADPNLTAPRPVQGQSDKSTSANAQPGTAVPCSLPKGTKLYGTAKGETWPLLSVDASHVSCVVDEVTPQDGRHVTLSAWVDAGLIGGDPPLWLSEGRILRPTNVRTAPLGDAGSEALGNVRQSTPFTVGKRAERKGHVWVELRIAAYRSAK